MIPYPSVFGPQNWLWDKIIPTPGEDLEDHTYYLGTDSWDLTDKKFAGSYLQWQEGCLSTDTVPTYDPISKIPLCCDSPIPPENPIIDSCSVCTEGALTWYLVPVIGNTGAAAKWNGLWTVIYDSGCTWKGVGPDGEELWLVFTGTPGHVNYNLTFFSTPPIGYQGNDASDCIGMVQTLRVGSGFTGWTFDIFVWDPSLYPMP